MTLTDQSYIPSQVSPAPSSRPSLENNAVPRHDTPHLRFIFVRTESVRCRHTRNSRVLFEQHSYPRRVSHNQRRQTSRYRSKVIYCCNWSQEINLIPCVVFALEGIRHSLYVSFYSPSLEGGVGLCCADDYAFNRLLDFSCITMLQCLIIEKYPF